MVYLYSAYTHRTPRPHVQMNTSEQAHTQEVRLIGILFFSTLYDYFMILFLIFQVAHYCTFIVYSVHKIIVIILLMPFIHIEQTRWWRGLNKNVC